MRTEYRTEVYLLTCSELRVAKEEAVAVEELAKEKDGGPEYTPVHSPRGEEYIEGGRRVYLFSPIFTPRATSLFNHLPDLTHRPQGRMEYNF